MVSTNDIGLQINGMQHADWRFEMNTDVNQLPVSLDFWWLIPILAAVLLLICILLIGKKREDVWRRITFITLGLSVIAGAIFYGYGYTYLSIGKDYAENTVIEQEGVALVKTFRALLFMFLGKEDISTIIKGVPAVAHPFWVIVINLFHALALYTTASGIILVFGTKIREWIVCFVLRHFRISPTIHVIYGASESSISFAEQLRSINKRHYYIFVESKSTSLDKRIRGNGALLFTDQNAVDGNRKFLKRIGVIGCFKDLRSKRNVNVYCLSDDCAKNEQFALHVADAVGEAYSKKQDGSRPCLENASATVLTDSAGFGKQIHDKKVFGHLLVLPKEELLARALIQKCPPYEKVTFDENAKCNDEVFEVLLIGFGRMAQTVLRWLIMNSQFIGCRFHATVIAKDYEDQAGPFEKNYGSLMREEFNCIDTGITPLTLDARSKVAYDVIDGLTGQNKEKTSLKYIIVCTGNDKDNREIALNYAAYLPEDVDSVSIIQCSSARITVSPSSRKETERSFNIYTPDNLQPVKRDETAKQVNELFDETEWLNVTYHIIQSCRANADFINAIRKASGGEWKPFSANKDVPGQMLNALGEMEHKRWCAFHYCMGFKTMALEDAKSKISENDDPQSIEKKKPWKDDAQKLHGCIVPWEDLDVLSLAMKQEKSYFKDKDMLFIQPQKGE